ncbi:RNA-binding protein P-like [Phragmites australis]|uniref:RNA-binding protein P-like n=1 Tax=Phragmites australis TaxID=29695 RepID=UPI002D786AEA|nr:RNA-binding protein P-like [Phragmites australis]
MGRKRKRHRKAEPPAERAERGMVHDEAVDEEEEEQDGKDSTTTNPPMAEPSAAGGCKEVSEAAAEEEEEDIGKLLEPFTRDELLDLLTDACLRDPALLARMASSAASDAAHRRLFVHGLGPGATSAALAAAFAPFGALDECHVVADRATSRCRGYGFVTYSRRSDARRALADASKRVGGHPVACQLAFLGPVAPSSSSSFSDRKLFVDNVPERVTHDELRRFFSRFGEIEEGPLGADRATGRFRGYAIFFYKSPEGLGKALEEPNKVFDGCELQCRRAHRVSKRKHAPAAPPDTGGQSSDGAVAAALPAVHHEDIALTPKQPLLGSNPLVKLTAKGSSSATATVLFRQNAGASGAGILGAAPVATALPSSPSYSASSTPPSRSGAALGHGGLSATARAGSSLMMPTTIGANNSLPHLQVQGSGAVKSQVSTGRGLIQHYLGR